MKQLERIIDKTSHIMKWACIGGIIYLIIINIMR